MVNVLFIVYRLQKTTVTYEAVQAGERFSGTQPTPDHLGLGLGSRVGLGVA